MNVLTLKKSFSNVNKEVVEGRKERSSPECQPTWEEGLP